VGRQRFSVIRFCTLNASDGFKVLPGKGPIVNRSTKTGPQKDRFLDTPHIFPNSIPIPGNHQLFFLEFITLLLISTPINVEAKLILADLEGIKLELLAKEDPLIEGALVSPFQVFSEK
jgi:hypothetical protein